MFLLAFLSALLLAATVAPLARAADAIPPIERVLPPVGLEIPADVRARLEKRLAETKERLKTISDPALVPDVEIFTKAVELALLHREFYVERDFAKADWALDQANQRLDSLTKGEAPWTKATGLVVRGYRSIIDNSAQPYGLVIPPNHDFSKEAPLYIWLHGRGDKNTDLHFLQERATRPGQFTVPNAIVVHPFGRHCLGWKHAGEIDVLNVARRVEADYNGDPGRTVLIGFSMGGAGAWHIGAHYADRWVAVSPGAGFVDTRRYQNITPENYPAEYVQKLWGLYDVPDYVRNLFNTNVIAYSGELDAQRKAAVLMEEAFQGEGRQLTHLIGPGVAHAYEPETLKELLKRLEAIAAKGQEEFPAEVHLQTHTLQYNRQHWVAALELGEHWREARIDAQRASDGAKVQTTNVTMLELMLPGDTRQVIADGQAVAVPNDERVFTVPGTSQKRAFFTRREGKWVLSPAKESQTPSLRKHPHLQGPIDDAFSNYGLLVVEPTGKSRSAAAQAWFDFEMAHFRDRWRALMRGELPVKKDSEVTDVDLERATSVILWGDPDSNRLMSRLLELAPVKFAQGKWKLGSVEYDAGKFVPALVYPRKKASGAYNYVVINSGLTFREGHDKTNSQQNPKLPDWAIIDITQPPDALAPGRIHDADFFDEQWQLKRQPNAP